MKFYDQIFLHDDEKSFHGVPSMPMPMPMRNKTMVEEEIMVGFEDEAFTIKERLAGGKKLLQMISIVGMPRLRLLAKNIKTQEPWKQVAQSVRSYIISDPNQYLDTLALSYNHLSRHLKP
ncbi:hypothetical protein ACSBR2_042482 [Camellia fascicularis]